MKKRLGPRIVRLHQVILLVYLTGFGADVSANKVKVPQICLMALSTSATSIGELRKQLALVQTLDADQIQSVLNGDLHQYISTSALEGDKIVRIEPSTDLCDHAFQQTILELAITLRFLESRQIETSPTGILVSDAKRSLSLIYDSESETASGTEFEARTQYLMRRHSQRMMRLHFKTLEKLAR